MFKDKGVFGVPDMKLDVQSQKPLALHCVGILLLPKKECLCVVMVTCLLLLYRVDLVKILGNAVRLGVAIVTPSCLKCLSS